MGAPVRDAVTAVLLHGDHLFLVQRHPAMQAFPGYHAFPGGKVEQDDSDAAPRHALFTGHDHRLVAALARELDEELGFDLYRAADEGLIGSLHCMDQVTTPKWAPVRFRTWFYKIVLNDRPEFDVDPSESVASAWRRLDEWKTHFAAGDLLLAPPTRLVLDALHEDLALDRLPPFPGTLGAEPGIPWVEPLGGLRILLVRSNTLPPASHTNVFWLGDPGSDRVLIDPAPANDTELERLYAYLDRYGADLVFLTHHHPDHRQHAPDIARRYRVPLAMSADTRQRIERREGADHFAGIEIRVFGDGDVLTYWQGQPVHTLAVPGHDEGQLAPMPASRAWCIVGDLIQGVGTVVVGGDEGNMAKYFDSLQRIIDLDPAVIIPSHGMAMGSTHYLREALRHRKLREAQVLACHQAGLEERQIFERVYGELDPRLAPLALVNIRSHLDKLRDEGRLG